MQRIILLELPQEWMLYVYIKVDVRRMLEDTEEKRSPDRQSIAGALHDSLLPTSDLPERSMVDLMWHSA